MVAVEEWMSRFERILYWVDNNNEMSLRPQAGAPQPVLKFRLDGAGDFVQLTAENMARLGLRAMPGGCYFTGRRRQLLRYGARQHPACEIYPYRQLW